MGGFQEMDFKLITLRERFKRAGLQAPITFGSSIDVPAYEGLGVIIKEEDLVDGAVYTGFSKKVTYAVWNSDRKVFLPYKSKIKTPLNYYANYDGTDVFIPVDVLKPAPEGKDPKEGENQNPD